MRLFHLDMFFMVVSLHGKQKNIECLSIYNIIHNDVTFLSVIIVIMTNLAKVVTSLIAEHMEQVVEDAFQHSWPYDENVELSEMKKPEKDAKKEEEKSSRHLSMQRRLASSI